MFIRQLGLELQHHYPNATHLLLIGIVILVHAPSDRGSPVVKQIIMQLAISSAEFEMFQEQRVILQSQGVEDVEIELCNVLVVIDQCR